MLDLYVGEKNRISEAYNEFYQLGRLRWISESNGFVPGWVKNVVLEPDQVIVAWGNLTGVDKDFDPQFLDYFVEWIKIVARASVQVVEPGKLVLIQSVNDNRS